MSGFYGRPSVLPGPETQVGALLAERKAALVADLGGEPSTAQLALVELAVRTMAILDATDAYVVSLKSPVDRRLWAVVVDRTRLAAQLESLLKAHAMGGASAVRELRASRDAAATADNE